MNTFAPLNIAVLLALSSSMAMAADYRHAGQEIAQVTHVQPVYQDVRINTPYRECHPTSVSQPAAKSYTGTIAGGIIGGVIGSQLGGGSGQKAMTVAGTLLGGSVGRDISQNRQQRAASSYQQTCQTVDRYHTEQQLTGYEVRYRYSGQEYTTMMDNHPGQTIPVDVMVRPSPQQTVRHYY